jgi:hypothetical protein
MAGCCIKNFGNEDRPEDRAIERQIKLEEYIVIDALVERLRKNIESGVRVQESWNAISLLAGAVSMPDWDEAFTLAFGESRKEIARRRESSEIL